VTIYAKTGSPTLSGGVGGFAAVGTRLLLHWSDIAIEQERLAWAARSELESEVEDAKTSGKGLDLNHETHPSLIAIAAASHALDALYGEIRDLALPPELVEKWRHRRPRRARQIHEALKRGFEISAQQWQTELGDLFKLRTAPFIPSWCSGNPSHIPLE
jgi:hypothetical protein